MKEYLLFVFFILLLFQAEAQDKNGRVASSLDSAAIEGAHILNLSNKSMAISNAEGEFFLQFNDGDTLVISNINFNSKQLIVRNSNFLEIKLNPANIQLEEVIVNRMPLTQSEFKNRVIDMGMQGHGEFVPFGLSPSKPKSKVPLNYNAAVNNSWQYAISKPISFIVKKFSKSHKNQVKYYETIANQGSTISNEKKYNPQLVTELTGLKDDDLVAFMNFLDLDEAFIRRTSEYEIAALILKEFEAYKIQIDQG